eukprot:TRINITY_DN813_c0_g1_i2.p1 TRINITY_DN813_c0_g1~~TRINITY_DN813_c0_g1_i2.p1  ORF type:complete len:867 (-),score=210.36 TRINITY_DN813_c0_g1_i2:623-3223(-)
MSVGMSTTTIRQLVEDAKLPKIPGQTFGEDMMRRAFNKRQLLKPGDVKDGGPSQEPFPALPGSSSRAFVTTTAADYGAADGIIAGAAGSGSVAAAGGAASPTGAASLSKVVLRFFGFFKEAVYESAAEKERVRHVLISYYCDDDTISVCENRNDQTGLSHGTLIRRHMIARPADAPPPAAPTLSASAGGAPNSGAGASAAAVAATHVGGGAYLGRASTYGPGDLLPGSICVFYGKSIYVTGCDEFTRTFLTTLGFDVAPNETPPEDAFAATRARMIAGSGIKRQAGNRELSRQLEMTAVGRSTRLTPADVAASRRFFEFDRQALRFYACWDDGDALFGDYHMFIVCFYLADGTIQVVEINPPNSGRDAFPNFCRRMRVPVDPAMAAPGVDPKTVVYYTASDLRVGRTLNLFGRPLLLYDCDPATRRFLAEHQRVTETPPMSLATFKARGGSAAVTEGNAMPHAIDVRRKGAPKPAVRLPEHTGFGTEEDALGAWLTLVPKPPKRDLAKFLRFTGSVNSTLRFEMRFLEPSPLDANRTFVLTYHQADDTVAVFEPQQRNSGIGGGKFLQRGKVVKGQRSSGRTASASGAPGQLLARDLYIGAVLDIHAHVFLVTGSDERTVAYMEAHPHQFPHSDVDSIVGKLRAMIVSHPHVLEEAFRELDADGTGALDYREFAAVFNEKGLPLTQHEVLSLVRFFDRTGAGQVTYRDLLAMLASSGPGAAEASAVMSPDQPWEANLAAQRGGAASASDAARARERRTMDYAARVAQQAADKLRVCYASRPTLWREALRRYAENSQDGCLGEQELRKATEELGADINENGYRALTLFLFPGERRRIPLVEIGPWRASWDAGGAVNVGEWAPARIVA